MYEQVPAKTSIRHELALPTDEDNLIARGLAALHAHQGTFDDAIYRNARAQFIEMARPYLAGNTPYNNFVRQFFREVIGKFGDGVKPYAIRFTKECEAEFARRDRNKQQRRKPTNLAQSADRASQDARYRQARMIFDRETAFGNWQLGNPAITAAMTTFRQLADEHYEQAYYPLSVLIQAGRRGNEDIAEARHLAQLAFEWSLSQSSRGDAERWCDLGDMYKNGHGTDPNLAEAEAWYRKAAERGDARGQWALGLCLYAVEGDAGRNAEALAWMGRAAAQGEPFLQCWLGDFYQMNGRHTEALYWYRLAALQDDKDGQFKLGMLFEFGEGIAQDDGQAAYWYRKAAKQGHAEAQWQLSQLYEYDAY